MLWVGLAIDAARTILGGAFNIFQNWQKKKLQKQESELKINEAVTTAKIQRMQTKQEGDIKWEDTALRMTGWKDEIMMIIILAPMVMCFIPGGAALVREGFQAMKESLPWYWEYAFLATIAISYGLKKFTDFMSMKKG